MKTGFLTEQELNIIRGKNLVGKANKKDIFSLFDHLDTLERELDELDFEDFFGTEGWRHTILGED